MTNEQTRIIEAAVTTYRESYAAGKRPMTVGEFKSALKAKVDEVTCPLCKEVMTDINGKGSFRCCDTNKCFGGCVLTGENVESIRAAIKAQIEEAVEAMQNQAGIAKASRHL